ncbi:MAG: class I SAM-dependent methyltransferase [Chloroflexi bacterium]|nr:class I SAM-dependent methyltransferase [Chloroflexota bacterium]
MRKDPPGQLYETIGFDYASARRPDRRIEQIIHAALGDARTVINVGAGTGNYEPRDRWVIAVEPAVEMIAQRPPDAAPAVRAVAENLPFRDLAFDAALAMLTLHHWSDVGVGLDELRRVARRQIIFLFEPALNRRFWLWDYFPQALTMASDAEAPGIADIQDHLQVRLVTTVPIPSDCTDGFAGANWRRPEAYLEASVREAISSIAQLPPEVASQGEKQLASDLASGAWDNRYGGLRSLPELDLGYRLVVAGQSPAEGR